MPRSERSSRALRAATLLMASACQNTPTQVLWGLDAGEPAADSGISQPQAGAAAPASPPPLTLQVDVTGATPACDTCATVAARAVGGSPPYTFLWSDPSLTGPGPHTICPRASTTYLALVTDGMGIISGQAAQVICSPTPDPDTMPRAPGCSVRAPSDVGTSCEADFASIPLVRSFQLSTPIVAGMPYQLDLQLYDLQFQLAIGLVAEIYGARKPCMREQLLGTLRVPLESMHSTVCLAAADQDYPYLVTVQGKGSVSIELAAVEGLSLCPECIANTNTN